MSNVINVENILNNEYVSIENNFNDFLRDTTSDGVSNIAEFITVYTTNQEINYFESDLHGQNYEENIKKGANFSCQSCEKFLFENQIHMLRNNVTVADEIFNKTCTLCSYCFRRIQNNDIPSISIKHNNLLIEPVPKVLNCLSSIEKKNDMFCRNFYDINCFTWRSICREGFSFKFTNRCSKHC